MQETRAEEISNSLSNLKKEEKNRAKKIQDVERLVQTLQADLAKPIQVEDMSKIDEENVCFFPIANFAFLTLGQRSLNQSHNGTRDRQFDLKEQQRRLVEDESRANAEVAEGERMYAMPCYQSGRIYLLPFRLKRLDDDSYRKLQNLAQHDSDCAAVIHWLRANKHRFRMEIIEPAAISLTVPNKDYVHAVESCFSITQLKVDPFPLISWRDLP